MAIPSAMSYITTNQLISVTNTFQFPRAMGGVESLRLNSWKGKEIANAIDFQDHVLSNRLVAGEITALYGEPKAGKTHLAVHCSVMAAVGGEFWGKPFPPNGIPVVYVAAERYEQAAQRILANCQSLGLSEIPSNLALVSGTSGLRFGDVEAMEELRDFVSEFGPELMVFDTYVRMVDNDEDKASDADRNIELLNGLLRSSPNPCAGILVHHSGKDANKKMRGSSALLAAVTTTWKVSKKKDGVICLSMEDANAFAPPPDCFFTVESVELGAMSSFHEPSEVGVAVPIAAQRDVTARHFKIYELMLSDSRKSWKVGDFIDGLKSGGESVSQSSVTRALDVLIKEGLITRSRSSKWYEYQVA